MEKSADSNTMKKSCAGLLFLPGEIIIDILSRLPVDSVIQCKRVCKTWRSLVDNDPTFLALHTHRFMIKSVAAAAADPCCCFFLYVNQLDHLSRLSTYRLHFGEYHENYDYNANHNKKNIYFSNHVKLSDKPTLEKHYPKNIFGENIMISCNGLILIASSYSTHCNNMMVFNPVTKEYVDLPPSGEEEEFSEFEDKIIPRYNHFTSTGFGYHPITKEYKIVRVKYRPNYAENRDHVGYISVYIYTLGRSSWSRRREIKLENNSINNTGFPSSSSYGFECKGVHLNGVVHWQGMRMDTVLSFDLADEEFKILPLPPPTPPPQEHIDGYTECTALGVLGGCLCFFRRIVTFHTTEIWVLSKHKDAGEDEEKENSYADSCSWTKKFSICEGYCKFVSALESGKVLFFRFNDEHLHFVSYDPETGNYVHDEGKSFLDPLDRWSSIIPYVKSFVSLKALGEDAKVIR